MQDVEQRHFEDIPPPVDYDKLGVIAGGLIQGTDGNLPLGQIVPVISRTSYGINVRTCPDENTLTVERRESPMFEYTFPLGNLAGTDMFIRLLAEWYSIFLTERGKVETERHDTFQREIMTLDADSFIITYIRGEYPPVAGDRVWTFAIHDDYGFEMDTNKISHWLNTKDIKGKASVMLNAEFNKGVMPWVAAFTGIGNTPDNFVTALGNLVKVFYLALRAFMWTYTGLAIQPLQTCQAANTPTVEALILFTNTFTSVTNITLRQMAELDD